MITSGSHDRDLPFVPTLLCLWCAGSLASLFTSFLFLGGVYSPSSLSPVMVAANLLLSAAIGAILLQYLLRNVVDYEIPYGATVVALVAGSSAGTVVRLVFLYGLGGGASTALRPVAVITFLPSLVGAAVSWWLLQNAARSPSSAATVEPPGTAVDERPVSPQVRVSHNAGDPAASAYSEIVSAVRESALGLVGAVNSVPPDSVPTVVAEGLVPYEAALKRLERAQVPSAVSRDLNERLLAGLRQLVEDLTLAAEEAATTAGSRLYQPGLLTASTADVSDGGGRYRWELEQSEGLRTVKWALDDLRAVGFGNL